MAFEIVTSAFADPDREKERKGKKQKGRTSLQRII
jgi:hypothetical protein